MGQVRTTVTHRKPSIDGYPSDQVRGQRILRAEPFCVVRTTADRFSNSTIGYVGVCVPAVGNNGSYSPYLISQLRDWKTETKTWPPLTSREYAQVTNQYGPRSPRGLRSNRADSM